MTHQESGNPQENSADEPVPAPEQESESQPAPPLTEFVEGEEHQVDPASIIVSRWIGMILVLGIGGLALVVLTLIWFSGMPAWLYGRLLVILGVPWGGFVYLAWNWPAWHHRHLRYWVDRRGLRIHRGVLWRKQISIPNTRVQHTDVTQGPLQRVHDLATLTIHTAGTQGASIPLSGLNHVAAMRLRDHLLPANRHGH